MTIKTIKHSDSMEGFQPNGLKRWRGFEVVAELGENENPDEAKDRLVVLVQNWHKLSNPEFELANYQPFGHITEPSRGLRGDEDATIQHEPDRTQAFIDLINSKYQTKKTLEALRTKVEQENNPSLTKAFEDKLKQLQ